jgi:hypothetical protein
MRRPGLVFSAAMLVLAAVAAGAEVTHTPGEPVKEPFEGLARSFLDQHCIECHDGTTAEADLNLLDLGAVDETNAAVWKSVWAQVALREMPPRKKPKPEVIDRLRFADWIVGELQRVLADKGGFHAHLDPKKANFVDHDLLFGDLPRGITLKPTSSPARLWRITPQEHITRLNELINTEPPHDPTRPGLRTHGDAVPTNHGGELKLYFGVDNILRWEGGTVAYATAVKSVPVVLSSARKHGFENYPDFYSVNSAEATQILGKAGDILKYMAHGPLSLVGLPEQITDDPRSYDKVKPKGDLRGLPTAIVYSPKFLRPATPLIDLMKEDAAASDEALRAAVEYLFEALAFRPPTTVESDDYLALVKDSMAKVGGEEGIFMGLSAIFLDRDALFRPELAEAGAPDEHGRVMLQDWELGLAVNHALRYLKPDAELRAAIVEGRMRTRGDAEREIRRMLADDATRKPRVLQFFRDYFDHDLGGSICKDNRALADTGVPTRGDAHYLAMFHASASTDRLIEIILEKDRDVLKELLTTRQVVATGIDKVYFGRKHTAEERKAALAAKALSDGAAKEAEEAALAAMKAEIAALEARLKETPDDRDIPKVLDRQKKAHEAEKKKIEQTRRQRSQDTVSVDIATADLEGTPEFARVSRPSFGSGSMKPERILATAPEGERLGILTHPSWLVSHSDAMDNHAIHRGIWIRERLLGGGIPDVPITVDAQLPAEPQSTLRERMRVTRETYCWTCHEKMDPLGLPFEIYNHAGLYRTTELDKPVDASGEIIASGDPALDGPVANAIEMIGKLAASERVEQVFVRHAFRFWMGRNETLHDSPVLQAAHRAYRDSGGSMKALITSLVTSDAFLYRTVEDRGGIQGTAAVR